jgi:hypothetical protein
MNDDEKREEDRVQEQIERAISVGGCQPWEAPNERGELPLIGACCEGADGELCFEHNPENFDVEIVESIEQIKKRLEDEGDHREDMGEEIPTGDSDFWQWTRKDDLLGFYQTAAELLLRELHDFNMLIDHCSQTYEHFSGGMITKPNTLPEEVFAAAEHLETERYEEAARDIHEAMVAAEEQCDRLEAKLRQFEWVQQGIAWVCLDCGGIKPAHAPGCELHAMIDVKVKAARRAALESAAWALSTWAASIDWEGGRSPAKWLEGLRERIEAVQALTSGPGMKQSDEGVDRQLEAARRGDLADAVQREVVQRDVDAACGPREFNLEKVELQSVSVVSRCPYCGSGFDEEGTTVDGKPCTHPTKLRGVEASHVIVDDPAMKKIQVLEEGESIGVGRAIHTALEAAQVFGSGAAVAPPYAVGADFGDHESEATLALMRSHDDGTVEFVECARGRDEIRALTEKAVKGFVGRTNDAPTRQEIADNLLEALTVGAFLRAPIDERTPLEGRDTEREVVKLEAFDPAGDSHSVLGDDDDDGEPRE